MSHISSSQHFIFYFIIDYKGGKCEICGYCKNQAAMQFHHINPKEKEFRLSQYISKDINDKIIKELNKCMLLCANCHFELHNPQSEI